MNPNRPTKTDRTRILRSIRKEIQDKKNKKSRGANAAMTYNALRAGVAK